MANLHKFLGSLVSSISDARAQSDKQTSLIAQHYANDNLLKHFSVPRMRIEDVELSIPVAIDSSVTKPGYEAVNTEELQTALNGVILKNLNVEKIPPAIERRIHTLIKLQVVLFQDNLANGKGIEEIQSISEYLASQVYKLLPTLLKQEKSKPTSPQILLSRKAKLASEISLLLKERIKDKPMDASNLTEVIVESSKLREIKAENIIMIKMKISEQGMEWVKIDKDNGETVSKLLPE